MKNWIVLRPLNAKPHYVASNSRALGAVTVELSERKLGPIVETEQADEYIMDVGGAIMTDAKWATVDLPRGGTIRIRYMHVQHVLNILQTLKPRKSVDVDGELATYYKFHSPIDCVVLSQADVDYLKQEFSCYPIQDLSDVELTEFNRRIGILRNESQPGLN